MHAKYNNITTSMEFEGNSQLEQSNDQRQSFAVATPALPAAVIQVGQYCTVCPPTTEELEKTKQPVDRIILPSDATEITDEDETVYVIGTRDGKVTTIAGLESVKRLKVRVSSYPLVLTHHVTFVVF
jgi:hypothetical protein